MKGRVALGLGLECALDRTGYRAGATETPVSPTPVQTLP